MCLIRPSVSQSFYQSTVRHSVSRSVRLVFFVSTTPLKTLNRMLCKSVVTEDTMCKCAYSQEILIHFFLGIMPLLDLEIFILLKHFVGETPLKPLKRIS